MLRAFSVHGEHVESIAPLTHLAFSLYKTRNEQFEKILLQIPQVDAAAISHLQKNLRENKMTDKKLR